MGLALVIPPGAVASSATSADAVPAPQADSVSAQRLAQAKIDIVDTLVANGSFTTLVQLVKQVGIVEDLRGFGRFTVFAPDDNAFAAVPPDVLQILKSDSALLAKVLTYHVVSDTAPFLAAQLRDSKPLRTLERSELKFAARDGGLYVNNARVLQADIMATNGVIHKIDKVLVPEAVMAEIRKRQQMMMPVPSVPSPMSVPK
ncbi:fasciclin domain-containing protein [Gloeobacter morelensis MG652769]|uniref:Fasciclin domain-containing protein n=2 Tax=Gloeobacter TaxID=33071 RepID=A0ABY3PUA3_9CYAN|nr:fasciclin domain-containing protein [Gloeobacter morelensis MG652769]